MLALVEVPPVPTMQSLSREIAIPSEYLQGDPWDDCEDIAEEDFEEFMSYSRSPWGCEDVASRIFTGLTQAAAPFPNTDVDVQAAPPLQSFRYSLADRLGMLHTCRQDRQCWKTCPASGSRCSDPRESLASVSTAWGSSVAGSSPAGSSFSLATSARSSIEPWGRAKPCERIASPERIAWAGSSSSLVPSARSIIEPLGRAPFSERMASPERRGIMSAIFATKAKATC